MASLKLTKRPLLETCINNSTVDKKKGIGKIDVYVFFKRLNTSIQINSSSTQNVPFRSVLWRVK